MCCPLGIKSMHPQLRQYKERTVSILTSGMRRSLIKVNVLASEIELFKTGT
jgi:hypothetical protein